MVGVKSAAEKERDISLDLMRIAASFFVIYNHTAGDGFFLFSLRKPGSLSFWSYLAVSVFGRFVVPLFFMVSGALLLGRKSSIKHCLGNALQTVGKLAVFALLYFLIRVGRGEHAFDTAFFLRKLYAGTNDSSHLWFLYAYVAFLISLPLLQSLAQHMENRHFIYAGVIVLAVNTFPVAEFLLDSDITLYGQVKPGWLMATIVIYPLMGYYLYHRKPPVLQEGRENRRWRLLLFFINLCGIAVSAYMTYLLGLKNGAFKEQSTQTFLENYVLVNAVTVFVLIRLFCGRVALPAPVKKAVRSMGECSFGIYVLHVIFLWLPFRRTWIDALTGVGLNRMLVCFLYCLFAMLGSYAATFLLKRLPLVKSLF